MIGQSVAVDGVPPGEYQQATEPRGLRYRPAERPQGRSSLGVLFLLFALLVPAGPVFPASKSGGTVGLKYLGHSSFLFTTPEGTRVLIDPFTGGDWPGLAWPVVHADQVLISHPHFDHNAWKHVRGKGGKSKPWESPGRYRTKGLTATGLEGRHSDIGAEMVDYLNTVFLIESGGIRFCHLGDNGPIAGSPDLAGATGPVDVLMIPIDAEQRVLTYEQADEWIGTLAPRVVIPMHYKVPGLSLQNVTGIGTLGEWLSRMPAGVEVKILGDDNVTLEQGGASLPPADGALQVWVFTLEGQRQEDFVPGLAEATDAKARADEALAEGDTATALEQLKLAARALPGDAEVRMKMGFIYLSGGRPDRALDHFSQGAGAAGETDPRSASLCLLGEGMALDLLGRREEALEAYRRVVELGLNDELQLDNARRYIEGPYTTE